MKNEIDRKFNLLQDWHHEIKSFTYPVYLPPLLILPETMPHLKITITNQTKDTVCKTPKNC